MGRPSHNRPFLAVAIALVAFASARDAHAEAPSIDVGDGVDGCPSSRELASAITTQLGHDPFDAPGAPRIVVRITKTDAAVSGEVTVTPPGSTRTFEGDSCADVVRAAALSVALAIESSEPPPPKPRDDTPPRPSPPRDEAPNGPAPSLGRDRVVIVASGVTAVGLLPRASAGVSANARLRISDMVWLSARGTWLPSTSMPNDAFAMSLADAALGACFEPLAGSGAALDACAHAFGGALAVTSHRDALADDATKGIFGARAGVAGRARLVGPLIVEGTADAILPFGHPTFVTTACPPTGFQQPFAAFVLGAGIGASIP